MVQGERLDVVGAEHQDHHVGVPGVGHGRQVGPPVEEVGPGQAGAHLQNSVSVTVAEVGGRGPGPPPTPVPRRLSRPPPPPPHVQRVGQVTGRPTSIGAVGRTSGSGAGTSGGRGRVVVVVDVVVVGLVVGGAVVGTPVPVAGFVVGGSSSWWWAAAWVAGNRVPSLSAAPRRCDGDAAGAPDKAGPGRCG